MWFPSWPRKREQPCPPPRRPAFRPTLESLEGRWVPTTLTVTSSADKGAGSLRSEIAAAHSGDTIVFAPGLDGGTITLTRGELFIGKNLTLEGPGDRGVTISGNNNSRVFEVSTGEQVNLSGLTISNGHAQTGGGILVDAGASPTLSNSTLSGNSVANTKQNFYASWGGGIENFGTTTVTGCTLSGNYASTGGSGIDNRATLTVNASTLTGNSDGGQGTIHNASGSTLTVGNNSAVSGNGTGGIVNLGTATIGDSTVSDNSGTGIANMGGATLAVSDSTLSGNSGDYGGGIENVGTATISNCILSDNYANNGGGIYNNGGALTITGSTLSGNTARTSHGGGIYVAFGTVTISDCALSGNSATFGGGIYVDTHGTVTVENGSVITGNTASEGGGIYNAGNLTVSTSAFSGNTPDDIFGPYVEGGGNTFA